MPLSAVTFKSFKGLITNVNYLDNNKISGNILLDCNNIQFSVDGVITSRHGHQELHVPVNNTTDIRTHDWYSMEFPLIKNGTTTAYIVADVDGVVSRVYSIAGSTITDKLITYNLAYTASTGLVSGNLTVTGQDAPTYYSSYNNYIRWAQSQNRNYFNAANGIFVENLVDPTDTLTGIYSRYTMPFVRSLATSQEVNSTGVNWFAPGKACKVLAMIVEYTDSTGSSNKFVKGIPSAIDEVFNIDTLQTITVTPTINVYNKRNYNNLYLQVYRTKQYDITKDPITGEFINEPAVDFYLCNEIAITKATTIPTAPATGELVFAKIELPLSDDALGRLPLYTNFTEFGLGAINKIPVLPPAARDFLSYKDYGIYLGVIRPPWTTATLTKMPVNTSDTLTIEGVTVTYGSGVGQVPIPANSSVPGSVTNGVLTAAQLTYRGPGVATNLEPLVIRAFDPSAILPTHNMYCAKAYAKGVGPITVVGTGDTRIIKMTPVAGFFDTSTPPNFLPGSDIAPGIMAIVRIDTSTKTNHGLVWDIVTFQDFEKIPNANTIEFYECVSSSGFHHGVASHYSPYDDDNFGAGNYYVFFLPGSSVENLSLYPIGTDSSSPAEYAAGYSLVPVYKQYLTTSTTPGFNIPVAVVSKPTIASSYVPASGITCVPEYLGLLYKPPSKLLDETVQNTIKAFNLVNTPYSPKIISQGEFSKFLIVGSLTGYSNSAFNNTININKGSSSVIEFDLDVPKTTPKNFSEVTDIQNGIIFSDQGQIETVPYQNMGAPLLVGDSKKAIQRGVILNDQLYVFKDNEGVYRIDLTNGLDTQALAPILVDNTCWLAATESIQVINDSIIFLSNRGVMKLYNGQIYDISNDIDKDLQEAVAIATKANIRSFKNDTRLQYGLCVGAYTYVLNLRTMDWLKWDLYIKNAYCFPTTGQLATQSSELVSTYNYIKYDAMTGNIFNNPVDQVDESIILTGVTNFTATGSVLRITRASGLGRFGNISNVALINNIANKTIWYLKSGVYYKAVYTSAGADYIDITFDSTIPVGNVLDSLVIGVNASITPHRFFAGGPDTITKFSKWVAQIQGSVAEMSTTFDVDTTNVAFTGQILKFTTVSETAITDIPRNQARGRWITCNIKHSYPGEYLTLLGLTWVAKDMQTFRVKWRN